MTPQSKYGIDITPTQNLKNNGLVDLLPYIFLNFVTSTQCGT